MAIKVTYGSPYSKVRGRAFEVLQEVNEEYRKRRYGSKVSEDFRVLSLYIKIVELLELQIMHSGNSFGYSSLFIIGRKRDFKEAIKRCAEVFLTHPELEFNMSNVSSMFGAEASGLFVKYLEEKNVPYTAKYTNTDSMVASAVYGKTTDDVIRYLKEHKISFSYFEGCVSIN